MITARRSGCWTSFIWMIESGIEAQSFRSCVKVEVAVLGSPSLILSLRFLSADVKQH